MDTDTPYVLRDRPAKLDRTKCGAISVCSEIQSSSLLASRARTGVAIPVKSSGDLGESVEAR